MRLRRPRKDKRSFTRRLADEEIREFVERELEETREVYRTSSGEFQLRALCRDAFASSATADLRWLRARGIDPDSFYRTELAPNWDGLDAGRVGGGRGGIAQAFGQHPGVRLGAGA